MTGTLYLMIYNTKANAWNILRTVKFEPEFPRETAHTYLSRQRDGWTRTMYPNAKMVIVDDKGYDAL